MKRSENQYGQRTYERRGEKLWSATTIISGGVPSQRWLVPWAKKYTAEYAVDHLGALTELVKVDRQGAVDWLKGAAYRERDRAADIGTAVHAAIEAYIVGKPMPKPAPPVAGRVTAFHQFLTDHQPEYLASEAPVFNLTQKYAGTLDGIVTLNSSTTLGGRTFVLDAKAGTAVYPEVALQLAAYSRAELIGLPDGSETPMLPVDGGCALHLTDTGYSLIEVDIGEPVWRAFLYAREVFRWCESLSKEVLLPEMRPIPQEVSA